MNGTCEHPSGTCKCRDQATGKVGFAVCEHYRQPDEPTVPERLRKLADLYEERNAVYGDDYKRHGDIMMGLFPDGVTLNTVADFNRYGIFKELVTKISRYAAQWTQGGHHESLNDNAVYSAMLQELDVEFRELYTIARTMDVPASTCKMMRDSAGVGWRCPQCDRTKLHTCKLKPDCQAKPPIPCGAHWRGVVVGNSNPIGCMECDTSWKNSNQVVCPKSRHIKL